MCHFFNMSKTDVGTKKGEVCDRRNIEKLFVE